MIIFVTGGSASGKSEYAGKLAERLASAVPETQEILYIATLADRSSESARRVERHQELRKKGNGNYRVAECFSLEELRLLASAEGFSERLLSFSAQQAEKRYGVVLFDSLDGFTADVLFGSADAASVQDDGSLAEKTAELLKVLAAVSVVLIVVSDAFCSDGIRYDEITRRYMEYTAVTEQLLAAAADHVIEVVCGIPLLLKGKRDGFLQIAGDNDVSVHEMPDALP